MTSQGKQKKLAKVIPFPKHRIVRWPQSMGSDAIKNRIKKLLGLIEKLVDAG